jgi:hypothetical protein
MVTLGVGIEDRCKHYLVSTLIRLGSNDNGLRCIFDSFFVKNIREQQEFVISILPPSGYLRGGLSDYRDMNSG